MIRIMLLMLLPFLISSPFAIGEVFLQCTQNVMSDLKLEGIYVEKPKGWAWISPKQLGKADLEKLANFNSCLANIYLTGEIENGDASSIEMVMDLRAKQGWPIVVDLNSPGGDIYEAMKIGRLLPERNSITLVNTDSMCASSCVLLFAGGARKGVVGGKLAIHRIQFANHEMVASLKQEDYRKLYDKGMDDVRTYLKEMGIRAELADEMMRYSSDEARILTPEEIRYYGLDQENPYKYEQEKSRWIALCGREWWELKQTLENSVQYKCDTPDLVEYSKCRKSIMDPFYKMCGKEPTKR